MGDGNLATNEQIGDVFILVEPGKTFIVHRPEFAFHFDAVFGIVNETGMPTDVVQAISGNRVCFAEKLLPGEMVIGREASLQGAIKEKNRFAHSKLVGYSGFGSTYFTGEIKMDVSLVVLILVGAVIFFAGLAVLIGLASRGKTKRREIEHRERLRQIELGQPLRDATVAKFKALGLIGVGVPVCSMGMGTLATFFLVGMRSGREYSDRPALLIVIWVVCGLLALTSVQGVLSRIQNNKEQKKVEAKKESVEKNSPGSQSLSQG